MVAGRIRVLILMLTDALCFVGVLATLVWGYAAAGFGHYAYGSLFYLKLWPSGIAFLALNALLGLYHRSIVYPAAPLNPIEELRRLVGSSLGVHLGTLAVLALTYQTTEHYSRAVILMSSLVVAFLAQPLRGVARRLMRRTGVGVMPVALVGDDETTTRLSEELGRDAYTGFRVAMRSASGDEAFVREAKTARIRIVLVCQDIRVFRCRLPLYAHEFTHVVYVPTADAFPVVGTRLALFGGLGGLEMINQREMRLIGLEKLVLDKTLAVIAFVGLLPFFVIVPLLIKLTSRGPVFYRQTRVGRHGRPIRVWKFRSMYADADARLQKILADDPVRRAEWEANFKLVDDPRVTPLGRFLRKSSIDEFPQLFNVFQGDMAFVGPRPIVTAEVPLYGRAFETVFSVRPGITGLWQVSGRSGVDYARRVSLDLQYALNWSPWMDIWILMRTVSAVFCMRGAW